MSATEEVLAEAEACYEQGDLEEALQRYRQVLDERPDDAEVLNDIATVCFAAGLLEESRRYYLRALAIDRNHEIVR
ncbi:MAG: tetratricopeptide repeat protein, partial [Candidatus Brocadiaceae bacterium]